MSDFKNEKQEQAHIDFKAKITLKNGTILETEIPLESIIDKL